MTSLHDLVLSLGGPMSRPHPADCIAFVLPSERALLMLSTGGFMLKRKRLRENALELLKIMVVIEGERVAVLHVVSKCYH